MSRFLKKRYFFKKSVLRKMAEFSVSDTGDPLILTCLMWDSFQCVFNYCTLFLCLFDKDRHAENRFDSGDCRLQSHFTSQIIVKGTLIG